MPGSGQVEQVTVRFQADINQYIQAIAQATKAIQGFASGAEGSTAKAMAASVKVAQAYSKVAQESGKVAIEQAKVAAAADKAALAHDRLASSSNKSSSSMGNMGSALRGVIGQYLSLGIAIRQISNIIKEGMDFNQFMEVSTTAFGVMIKSIDQAKTKMKELFDYAVVSPLTFRDVVSASRQLMAYGFTARELIPTIDTLGIVAKATGVSLGDMAYVYGTLRSQGRAYTRDLMQFAMRGVPIYEELAKVIGKPVGQLQKMTEQGKIGFAEVEKAFQNMTTGTGRFAGFFDEYMKTFEGKMSMLTDVWQQATGKLTKAFFESLKPLIDGLTKYLQENGTQWTILGGKISEVLQYIIKIKDAFIAIGIGLISNQILKILIPAIVALQATLAGTTGLVATLGAVSTALGGWPVLIAGAVAALVLLLNKINDIRAAAPKEGSTWSFVEPIRNTQLDSTAMGGSTASPYAQRIFGAITGQKPIMAISAEEQAKLDEAAKALEKMMDLLRKYQDEWAMIQAKNLVTSGADVYAVANLENKLRIEEMKEKLKGYDSILTQALSIQKLIHQDAIDKINKEVEAKKQASRDASLDVILKARTDAMAPYWASQEGPNDKWKAPLALANSELDKVTKQIAELDVMSLDYDATLKRLTIEQGNYNLAIAFYTRELHKGELADYEKAAQDKMVLNRRITASEKAMLEDLAKDLDEKVARYDNMMGGGDPAFYTRNKISAVENFDKHDYVGFAGNVAVAATQGMGGIGKIVQGFSGGAMSGIMSTIGVLGGALGALGGFILNIVTQSKPIMDLIEEVTYSVSQALMPVIETLANMLRWLYDSVIVPVGNALIDIINGVIGAINNALGWLGVNISKLDHLMTTFEAKMQQERLKTSTDALSQTIDALKKKLEESVNSQIQSYKDLYEVGAMSATDYAEKSKAAYDTLPDSMTNLLSTADAQLIALGDTGAIATRLNQLIELQTTLDGGNLSDTEKQNLLSGAGIGDTTVPPSAATPTPTNSGIDQATIDRLLPLYEDAKRRYSDAVTLHPEGFETVLEAATVRGYKQQLIDAGYAGPFATGTSNIPNDSLAMVHKGEGIIPATFMDSIRKGDLSLSGGGGNGGGNINVTVNVAGSVRTERDLATSIATEIYRQRRSGLLTV